MSGFMVVLITALHIAACIALMVVILLQSGKGGGLAGTFGAGSSQTLFGGRGAATFLTRAATVLAVVFFVTSLSLGLSASRRAGPGRSLIQEEARRRAEQQGGTPQPGSTAPTPGGTTAPGQAPAAVPPTSGPAPIPGQGTPTTTPGPPAPQGSEAPQGGGTR